MQFGLNDSARQVYMIVDGIIAFGLIYLIIRPFNNKRGIAYLATVVLAIILLIATAYLTLPSIHLLTQFAIVVLIIGLPLYFDDIWANLFGGEADYTQKKEKYLGKIPRILFSVMAALLLMLISTGVINKTAELPQGVKISAVNLPEGVIANFGSQEEAKIIITAPRDKWSSINADTFSASVDIGQRNSGTLELPITVTSKLGDIIIVRVIPSRVTVAIEPLIKKTVNVVAKFSGKALNDLVPAEPVIDPNKVEISGSKSIVNDLTQAVIMVSLDNQTQVINQKFSLVALSPDGEKIEGVSFSPSEVTAKIELVKAGKQKTVGIKPKINGSPAAGYWLSSIELSPSSVVITGPVDVLESVMFVETESVSISGLSQTTQLNTTLSLPSGITLIDNIKKISVKLGFSQSDLVKSINPEISYDGLASALQVKMIDPASITLYVSGPVDSITSLNGSSVRLKLNLSAYKSAGSFSVSIGNTDFVLPQGVSIVSYLPSAINVTLENK